MSKLIEHIGFTGSDPYPRLRGYDIKDIRIMLTDEGQHVLEIKCPCCLGERQITGTVECQGGNGCDHDISMDCQTCDGMGVCEIEERYHEDGSDFFFQGWEDDADEPFDVPVFIRQKLRDYRVYMDPNQLGLFGREEG